MQKNKVKIAKKEVKVAIIVLLVEKILGFITGKALFDEVYGNI